MQPTIISRRVRLPQDLPDTEPPIGTVASFSAIFTDGRSWGGPEMLRTENGWSPDLHARFGAYTWAELTDPDSMSTIVSHDLHIPIRVSKVQITLIDRPQAPTT